MAVLRANKDSLMAVLEAFVYDPLLNWRLVENTNLKTTKKRHESSASTASASLVSTALLLNVF